LIKYYGVRGEKMKLPDIKILDEKEKVLHQVSKEVTFPLTDKQKKDIKDMLLYLRMSQIEEYSEKYNLRPGMGLSYVQIGELERIFVICDEVEEGQFEEYVIINPEIISQSEEMIYVGEGEGCLSINREVEGIVPRHARITVEAYDEDGNKFQVRVREDIAIAFQHEMDHLNGILFTDKIDPKNPFKGANNAREI
jgi:peptide deformylase